MSLKYILTVHDDVLGDFEIELKGYNQSAVKPINGRAEVSALLMHIGGAPGQPGIGKLMQALEQNVMLDNVKLEVRDDADRLVERITVENGHVPGLSLAAGTGGGDAAFTLYGDRMTLESSKQPGGALDQSVEFGGGGADSGVNWAFPYDLAKAATPVGGSDYAYTLKIAGEEIKLSGYELDMALPASGARTASALLVRAPEGPGQADFVKTLKSLLENAHFPNTTNSADVLLEVRNTSSQLVSTIKLTDADINAQGTGGGEGASQTALALSFDTLELTAWATPGLDSSRSSVTIDPPSTAILSEPVKLVGAAAHGAPGSGLSYLLTVTKAGQTFTLDVDGYEFDAGQGAGRSVASPLVLHVGGAPGQGAFASFAQTLFENGSYDQAKLEAKNASGQVLHEIKLTTASVIAQNLASGGGGNSSTVVMEYAKAQISSAETPGGGLTQSYEIERGGSEASGPGAALYAGDLEATPPIGGGYTYKFVMEGMEFQLRSYELDMSKPTDASSGLPVGRASISPLVLHMVQPPGDGDAGRLLDGLLTNKVFGDGTLEVRNAAGEIVNRIKVEDPSVITHSVGAGGGRSETTVSLRFSKIEYGAWDTPGSANSSREFNTEAGSEGGVGFAGGTTVGPDAEGREGSSVTYKLTITLDGQDYAFDAKGYDLNAAIPVDAASGLPTGIRQVSPLYVHIDGEVGQKGLAQLLAAIDHNATIPTVTLEARDSSDVLVQRITLDQAALRGEALAAGAGGASTALMFTYHTLNIEGANTPGGPLDSAVNIAAGGTSEGGGAKFGTSEDSDFGGQATLRGGSDYTYHLKIDGRDIELTGYELDSLQPFEAGGQVSEKRHISPLVIHLDTGPGSAALNSLLEGLTENAAYPNTAHPEPVVLEVRNSDGVLVNKITLTDAQVQAEAIGAGVDRSASTIALTYSRISYETFASEGGAGQGAIEIQAGTGTESGTGLDHLTFAQITAMANAVPAGWVETLASEVKDFFHFVRYDAPQRALGGDGGGAAARGASVMSLSGDDLAALSEVPILGDKIIPKIEQGLDVFHDVEDRILDAIYDLPDSDDAARILADKLNGIGINGLEAQADGTIVTLSLAVGDTAQFNINDFGVDVGNDILGLTVNADANVRVATSVNLLLQVDVETGRITILDGGQKEIEIGLDAGIDFEATAGLGFLQIDVRDNKIGVDEISLDFGLDLPTTSLGDLSIDAIDLTLAGEAHLDLGITTKTPTTILPTITGDLVIDWAASNVPGAPGLGTNISLNDVTLDLGGLFRTLAQVFEPLNDLLDAYPLGMILDALTAPLPVIDTLARKAGIVSLFDRVPGTPDGHLSLLDVASAYSRLQGNESAAVSIEKFGEALRVLDSIRGSVPRDDLGVIHLGSFNILSDSPAPLARGLASLTTADTGPGIQPKDGNPTRDEQQQQINDNIKDSDDAHGGVKMFGTTDGRDGISIFGDSPFATGFIDKSGFSLPILDDATAVVRILLNKAFPDQPVSLMQFDLPALQFAGEYQHFFPVVGPIGAIIGGEFGGFIDLAIGYDTAGLAASDWKEGFYFTTQPKIDEPGFHDLFETHVGIEAGAGVNVGVASAGVVASIGAQVTGALAASQDPNSPDYGKLRLSDIGNGIECIINPVDGKFTAELGVYISFGWGPFKWTRHIMLADATLAEFRFGCKTSPEEMKGLASLSPDGDVNDAGVLMLNVGPRAHDYRYSVIDDYNEDHNESYVIRNALDDNGHVIAGALDVLAFTVIETFGDASHPPITVIKGNFNKENDSLVIADDVLIGADVQGGDGNDYLQGGGGNDTLRGGKDDDMLIGGSGDDKLYGDDGVDTFIAGAGADYMNGGGGGGADKDQISYEDSADGVIFESIQLNNGVYEVHGRGGDAEGDILVDIEYIIGSKHDDILRGIGDDENTLEGLAGNDLLVGGNKNDFLLGGIGADTLLGRGGEDGTSYLTSMGNVVINLQTGFAAGGDATGDYLESIEDVQGSAFDDLLIGSDADNKLDGFYGDDIIQGGRGADELTGAAGDDIIYAGADGDKLDGGEGHDLLSYQRFFDHGVEVHLVDDSGGDGWADGPNGDKIAKLGGFIRSTFEDLDGTDIIGETDRLYGDQSENRIRGFAGDDIIRAGGGNDVLVGGYGADELRGDAGRDLVDYRDASAGVIVDLVSGGSGGEADGDTFFDVEDIRGSDFTDKLYGNELDNRIDPGLSGLNSVDVVNGRGGTDTLVVDYSRGDYGTGVTGGFAEGQGFSGAIYRRTTDTPSAFLNIIGFDDFERIEIVGTSKDDNIAGGGGADLIVGGAGNDTLYGGGRSIYGVDSGGPRLGTLIGADRILAGGGNDTVFFGVDDNRHLTRDFVNAQGTPTSAIPVFFLDGGSGTDTLSISLSNSTQAIRLAGGAPINLTLANGAAVTNFEILGDVFTGSGNDALTQLGVHDNNFDTGAGQDIISSGLGNDTINGGVDFVPGADGVVVDLKNNAGDLLILDFTGVAGRVSSDIDSTRASTQVAGLTVQKGHFASAAGRVDYDEIERIHVTGSSQNDGLVGTDNYGITFNNLNPQTSVASSQTQRGRDIINGGAGDDLLHGLSGNDILDGGAGDDALIGANANWHATLYRDIVTTSGPYDDTEVDTLTGGAGKDVFVLGDGLGFFYGDKQASSNSRAIITDFSGADGDSIVLWGGALYEQHIVDGKTLVYMQILNPPDSGFPPGSISRLDLVAELWGAPVLDLPTALAPGEFFQVKAVASPAARGAAPDGDALVSHVLSIEAESGPMTSAGDLSSHVFTTEAEDGPMIFARESGPTSDLAPAAASVSALTTPWITQTANPADLGIAFAPGSGVTVTGVRVEGAGESFGTVSGDPFGIGQGIIVSTGAVADLAGPNTIDGGHSSGSTKTLAFTRVATFEAGPGGTFSGGEKTLFVANLSDLGIDLNSITLTDSNIRIGGSAGVYSGFDIDTLFLSRSTIGTFPPISDAAINNFNANASLDVLDFDAAHLFYTPGTMRPPATSGASAFLGPDFIGTVNGIVNNAMARLDRSDSDGLVSGLTDLGSLTLGDGGSLGINFNQTVSTDGQLYLYIVESGSNAGVGETIDGAITVSDQRIEANSDLSTDVGLPGPDKSILEYTLESDTSGKAAVFEFLAFTEELAEFAGGAFNDQIVIKLNGVNLATLNNGAALTVNNLMTSPQGPTHPDLILNPVGTGPLADQVRADAYTQLLHYQGTLQAGTNTLTIEVTDVGDGDYDTGVILRTVTPFDTVAVAENEAPHFVERGDAVVQNSFFGFSVESWEDVLIQPDGSIVAAGRVRAFDGTDVFNDFAIARYTPDGKLDTTFAQGGFRHDDFTGIAQELPEQGDAGWALARQSDGKIVVVGQTGQAGGQFDVAIARYNTDGSLDTSFSGDGKATTHVDGRAQVARDVAIAADGTILVAVSWSAAGGPDNGQILRYAADGTLQQSFNTFTNVEFQQLAIQADGKIVALGSFPRIPGEPSADTVLVRYNTDGTVDTSFGANGAVFYNPAALGAPAGPGGLFKASSLAIDASGNIVVGGAASGQSSFDPPFSPGFVRFTPTGQIQTFGFHAAEFPFWNDGEVVIQPDGKIVIAAIHLNGDNPNFGVVRYNANGTPDTTFGSNSFGGQAATVVDNSAYDLTRGVALDSEGRIILVGQTGNNSDFAVVRLLPDGTPDTGFDHFGLDGAITVIRGGAALIMDNSAAVIDPELSALGSYAGASLSLSRIGGAKAEDVFDAAGRAQIVGGELLVDGVVVGAVANGAGALAITFNEEASQEAVNATLTSLTYANTTATGPQTSIDIGWTFSDGFTGVGGPKKAIGATSVTLVEPPNNPPVPGTVTPLPGGTEDTTYTINASALLADFSDPEHNPLSITSVAVSSGSVVNAGGVLTITPAANFNGPLTLTFTVSDGRNSLSGQTRTINFSPVDDAPIALAPVTPPAGTEDVVYSLSQSALLAQYSEVDGETLTLSNISVSAGTLVVPIDGTALRITPPADFNGPITLRFDVSDGHTVLSGQTRTITFTPVNDAPALLHVTPLAAGTEDVIYTVSKAALLGDYMDVEHDPITITGASVTNGAIVDNGSTFTITPNANFNGPMTLSFSVKDLNGAVLPGQTRTIQFASVNDAPIALAAAPLDGVEDTAFTVSKLTLASAFRDDDGDTLTFSNVSVSAGSVVDLTDGTGLRITPPTNFSGPITLRFDVSDGHGGVLTGQSRQINFAPVNDVPTAVTVTPLPAGQENTPYSVAKATLLAGFTDVDGDTLTISNFRTSTGTIVDNGTTLTITPAANFNGAASIIFDVSDGHGGVLLAQTRALTFAPSNVAPVITSNGGGDTAAASVVEGLLAVTTVHATDANAADVLRYKIVGGADAGRFSLNETTGALAFVTAPDFEAPTDVGPDNRYEVQVEASDGHGGVDRQSLTVAVTNKGGVTIIGTQNADTINATRTVTGQPFPTNEEDNIQGRNGIDTINGLGGNDTISGGGGNDILNGDDGDDTFLYVLGEGADKTDGGAGFDRLIITGSGILDTLAVIYDGTRITKVEGGTVTNIEAISVGLGSFINVVSYSGSMAAVNVNLAAGTASGFASLASANIVLGGEKDDILIGDSRVNGLTGGAGNDLLIGGGGWDVLVGGDGIDTVSYESDTAAIQASLADNLSRRGSSIEDTLIQIENLIGGAGADTLIGDSGANVLTGNGGADILIGGRGADKLRGGLGDDSFRFTAGDGADDTDGGDGVDLFEISGGNSAEQVTVLFDGAKITEVDGGGVLNVEKFTLNLGGGIDTLSYAGGTAAVTVDLTAGTASGFTSFANVENAIGGSGADRLVGRAGVANTLTGGAGDDTFVVHDTSDVLVEAAANGMDTVESFAASYTLSDVDVENLIYRGTANFTGTGNAANNTITGGAANDTLNGAAGDDRLTGGAGNDTMDGGAGNDTFVATAGFGTDTVNGFDANPSGGQDKIDLTALGITATTFGARVRVEDLGNDTRVTVIGEGVMLLKGVNGTSPNIIDQADFVLAPPALANASLVTQESFVFEKEVLKPEGDMRIMPGVMSLETLSAGVDAGHLAVMDNALFDLGGLPIMAYHTEGVFGADPMAAFAHG